MKKNKYENIGRIIIYVLFLGLIILPLTKMKIPIFIDIVNIIGKAFIKKIDTFATIATVLVGIYFSLFTILMTADGKSIVSFLDKLTLRKLTGLIAKAFFCSMFYMFSPLVSMISVGKNLLGWVLFLYFVALVVQGSRLGIYFFKIINVDIDVRLNKLKEESEKQKSVERMIKKMYDERKIGH